MKAIIYGPETGASGIYYLILETGQPLCSHFCSSSAYAESDLFKDRPERRDMFKKAGVTEFVWLKDSGLTKSALLARNKAWASGE